MVLSVLSWWVCGVSAREQADRVDIARFFSLHSLAPPLMSRLEQTPRWRRTQRARNMVFLAFLHVVVMSRHVSLTTAH